MQTLCVLHRYNRQGVGSWYPTGLYAYGAGRRRAGAAPDPASDGDGWYA